MSLLGSRHGLRIHGRERILWTGFFAPSTPLGFTRSSSRVHRGSTVSWSRVVSLDPTIGVACGIIFGTTSTKGSSMLTTRMSTHQLKTMIEKLGCQTAELIVVSRLVVSWADGAVW